MATKSIGPVIVAAIAANVAATAILGARVCAEGGVLQDEDLPYATYKVDSNAADRDLDGSADGYFADVSVTVTATTYDGALAAINAVATALDDLGGTFASVVVTDSTVEDVADEVNGPIDSSDGEVFQADLTVVLAYQ